MAPASPISTTATGLRQWEVVSASDLRLSSHRPATHLLFFQQVGAVLALAVFAIEQVAHRLPASFVSFLQSLAFVGVPAPLGNGVGGFGFAARRTAVREAGLVRLQLELFRTDGTDADGECHANIMIQAVPTLQTMFVILSKRSLRREKPVPSLPRESGRAARCSLP